MTRGRKSRADQLVLSGQLEEACQLYETVCRTDPADVEGWVKLGVTQRRLGRHGESEVSCRRALRLAPRLYIAHQVHAEALHCLGRHDEAIAGYRRAIQLQPNHPDAHYLLGSALMDVGELQHAIVSLKRAIVLRPDFFEALSDLGAALLMVGRSDEAHSALQQALALRPNSAEALANLANLVERDARIDEALALYERALRAQPDSLDVRAKQAELLERSGRLAEAHAAVEQGLAREPTHPFLNLVAARLDRRAGRNESAAARLEAALSQPASPQTKGEIHLLLGQLYDRLGRTDEVLAHLTEGKRRTAMAADADGAGRARFLHKIETARTWVGGRFFKASEPSAPSSADSPIFLIGFPRSGTTLLEQVLDSHPALQTMEEKPAAAAVEHAFIAMTGGGPASLVDLDHEQVAALRKVYFDAVSHHLARRPGTLLVDKLPLNTVRVPLLWRVFPHARFILAIRHPCDVTLSCLMQNFGVNDAMAGFVSLTSIAEIYARVMNAWREFAERLPLLWHRIRYEDLTASPEREARALLQFLGVDWDEAVLDHTRRALTRAVIKTPSYHQVSQPIYQHARYRWKRYESEFAPIMATLRPFIECFGYAE